MRASTKQSTGKKRKNKLTLTFLILFISGIAFLAYFVFSQFIAKTYIASDTVVKGDYTIDGYKTVIVKNSAKLIVEGDMVIKGTLECLSGSLFLEVKGKFVSDGVINCQRSNDTGKDTADDVRGITLVLGSFAQFGKNSIVVSNSHIQFVDSEADALVSKEEFARAFDEIAKDSGEGVRLGPFIDGKAGEPVSFNSTQYMQKNAGIASQQKTTRPGESGFLFVKPVFAQEPPRWVIDGVMYVGRPDKPLYKKINVNPVPEHVYLVIILFKTRKATVELEDGEMRGAHGKNGNDMKGVCVINLPKTESVEDIKRRAGFRMGVYAKKIVVRNYSLYLGDGGRGGNAETAKEICNPGIAVAGKGGQPSNIKWSGDEGIEIKGTLSIFPGKGGNGGDAIAYGKDGEDGCPGKDGASVIAAGGEGASTYKILQSVGNVTGKNNIVIGQAIGGDGGNAKAFAGNGGNGTKCGCSGGLGGEGVERGGRGGSAVIEVPDDVEHDYAQDKKGQDGLGSDHNGQDGKNGVSCQGNVSSPTPKLPKRQDPAGKAGTAKAHFEIVDAVSGQPSQYISGIEKPHVIVVPDDASDIRLSLPINLVLKAGGKVVWNGAISGDAALVCRGANGCSMTIPKIEDSWLDTGSVELLAYDKNGKLIATFID